MTIIDVVTQRSQFVRWLYTSGNVRDPLIRIRISSNFFEQERNIASGIHTDIDGGVKWPILLSRSKKFDKILMASL